MARCRRRYTWTVEFDDPLMPPEVAPRVRAAVQAWTARRRIESGFTDPVVGGEFLGALQVSVIIDARDRWQVRRLAARFATAIAAAAKIRMRQLSEPVPEKLPPHMNRGRHRWPGQPSSSTG